MSLRSSTFLVCLLLGAPVGAHADTPRHGLFVGASGGGGVLARRDCQGTDCTEEEFGRVSLPNLRLGYRLSNRFALEFHIAGGVHEHAGERRAFDALLVSAKWWALTALWISAGTGIGEELPPAFEGSGPLYIGAGAMAGMGYEFYRGDSLVFDLSIRATTGRLGKDASASIENVALDGLLGITWYPYTK